MSSLLLPEPLERMRDAVNQLDIPAFLLIVDPDGKIRFGGLNPAHEARTGMTTDAIAGHAPHDILPPRMADTILANYNRCLQTKAPYTYDEVLELPKGKLSWQTTLSPIFDSTRIVGIVGVAADITEHCSKQDSLLSDTTVLRAKADAMETLAHATVSQMRGPLNNIATMARILQTEGDEALKEQPELLEILLQTTVAALHDIDGFEIRCKAQPVREFEASTIDFAHFLRDQAAIVDPDRDLTITFPELRVQVERAPFESAVSAILEHAARRSERWIGITTSTDPSRPRAIAVEVRCDAPAPVGPDPSRNWLISAARSRGGQLTIEDVRTRGDEDAMSVYHCSFPGRIISGTAADAPAKAVNRRLKELHHS